MDCVPQNQREVAYVEHKWTVFQLINRETGQNISTNKRHHSILPIWAKCKCWLRFWIVVKIHDALYISSPQWSFFWVFVHFKYQVYHFPCIVEIWHFEVRVVLIFLLLLNQYGSLVINCFIAINFNVNGFWINLFTTGWWAFIWSFIFTITTAAARFRCWLRFFLFIVNIFTKLKTYAALI